MSTPRFGDRSSNSGSGPHSLISQPSGEQGTPLDYAARVESFSNYPPPHYVNVLHLAKHGFIFEPTPSNPQQTFCVQCKKVVSSWNEGARPFGPEFHEQGCRYSRTQTPSEHSGSITDVSESLFKASVHSNEESTKPLETAGTSGVPPERAELPELPYRGMQSYLTAGQVQARQAFSVPTQITQPGIPPATQYSLTRLRSRDEGGSRTSEVEHIQAQHHPHSGSFGHRSAASTPPPQSFQSYYPQSTFSGIHSGTFSNLTYPREEHGRHSSYERHSVSLPTPSAFQSPRRHQPRLENEENLEEILGSLDMRDAQHRLRTFEQFWSEDNVFRNYRLLVVCGFFCIGQGDAVECFCCHVIIANWSRDDNPRRRHIEMSRFCRFMQDEECGNIPLAPQQRRTIRTQHSSHSSHHSSPQHSFIAHPSMEGAVGPSPTHHPSMQGAAGPASISHSSFQSSMGPVAERYSNPTSGMYQRSNLLTEFPCSNPANVSMREEHARLQTFFSGEFRRYTRLRASNEALARAGLYYVGQGDSVKCWFCDGGLRDFQPWDDPWVEHAKFFPECEYLLQQRGPDWITRISVQNPNIQRPILPQRESRILPQVVSSPTPLPPPPPRIEDPDQLEQYRRQLLEEGMQSEPAQRAREMGYSDDRIRHVQWQKILMDDCTYQSAETLINALTPDIQPADSSSSSSGGSSGAGASPNVPVIEMPDNHINIHSANVLGPTFINGQMYPPSSSSSNTSNLHFSTTTTTHHSNTGTGLFINGQPMDEFMANAFDHPFFRGEMNHLLTPTGSTVYHSEPTSHSVHHHRFSSPAVRPPVVRHYHYYPPRAQAPTSSQQSHAPTVPPPPRPPLQAINIPRRNAPRSSTSSVPPPPRPPLQPINIPRRSSPSSSTGASTSSSSTVNAPSGATASTPALEGAAAQNRIAELERERTCKICLNSHSVVLFRPCGHICCCEDCARRVTSCPVCRRRIHQYIRTYHA